MSLSTAPTVLAWPRSHAPESKTNKPCLRGDACSGCGAVVCPSCGRRVCGIATGAKGTCLRCSHTPHVVVIEEHAPTVRARALEVWGSVELLGEVPR
jgi:hypothetical protein